jgi:hypothetical protein
MDARSTIIYYTSNREEERFERVIQEQILRASNGMRIISVSQKPIDFGENICVGEIGVSNQNAHRQFQLGCVAAKTQFVHAAESDTLYPAEYFSYIPENPERAYRTPVYLFRLGGNRFYRKKSSEAATIAGREYVIDAIEKSLRGRGQWHDIIEHGNEVPYTFPHGNWVPFVLSAPIITIKTPNQMHKWHGHDEEVWELPYWGTAEQVNNLFL